MTHDINPVGLAAGVVIGWHLRELTNLEAKLSEDVRHFKKVKAFSELDVSWEALERWAAFPSARLLCSVGCDEVKYEVDEHITENAVVAVDHRRGRSDDPEGIMQVPVLQ
jgi:hypothetical protein